MLRADEAGPIARIGNDLGSSPVPRVPLDKRPPVFRPVRRRDSPPPSDRRLLVRATFRLLALVPPLFALIGCKAAPPQADASSVVQEFYTATITGHVSGAPTA